MQTSAGLTGTRNYTLVVNYLYDPLAISTASLPGGQLDLLYSQPLAATGGGGIETPARRGRGCDQCLNRGLFDRTAIYEIFVMDEATSSIDTETEQLIQRGLETIFAGRISFVIAHRLSTVRAAHRIVRGAGRLSRSTQKAANASRNRSLFWLTPTGS